MRLRRRVDHSSSISTSFSWRCMQPVKLLSTYVGHWCTKCSVMLTLTEEPPNAESGLSQYRKSGSMFAQVSRSLPAATAADSETPWVYDRPSDQPKLCWSAAPRARPLILPSKPLIVFWNSLREWLTGEWQGLKLELRFELCSLTNGF